MTAGRVADSIRVPQRCHTRTGPRTWLPRSSSTTTQAIFEAFSAHVRKWTSRDHGRSAAGCARGPGDLSRSRPGRLRDGDAASQGTGQGPPCRPCRRYADARDMSRPADFLERSEEGDTLTLGLIPGTVRRSRWTTRASRCPTWAGIRSACCGRIRCSQASHRTMSSLCPRLLHRTGAVGGGARRRRLRARVLLCTRRRQLRSAVRWRRAAAGLDPLRFARWDGAFDPLAEEQTAC